MQKLLYFEAVTWQRLLTLTDNKDIPQKHTDMLRGHLELLVAAITALRLAPAWRKRALANQAGAILLRAEEAMRGYRDRLIEQRVGYNWDGVRTFVRTWSAIRYDARTILRAHDWREPHALSLAPDPDAEGKRWWCDLARATRGMSLDEVREITAEFFEQRGTMVK